jgi:hypothetical protein
MMVLGALPSHRPRNYQRWYVAVDDKVLGPHDEEFIVSAIESGQVLKAHIRIVGELKWNDLRSHPPFARALTRAASTAPIPAFRSRPAR